MACQELVEYTETQSIGAIKRVKGPSFTNVQVKKFRATASQRLKFGTEVRRFCRVQIQFMDHKTKAVELQDILPTSENEKMKTVRLISLTIRVLGGHDQITIRL